MAQQSFELRIGHLSDLAGVVAFQLSGIVGAGSAGALYGDLTLQADIGHAGAHHQLVHTAFNLPGVGLHIKVAEGLVIQLDGNGFALACLQEHFGEALQLLGGAEHLAAFAAHIQLGHLGAIPLAGIGQGEGYLLLAHLQITVFEGGVGQAEAEGEPHRHAGGLVVAIAHIQALAVFTGALQARVVGAGGVFLTGHGVALGQLGAGVHLAGDHTQYRTRACLTAQVAMDQSLAAVQPGHLNRAACRQYHHQIGVHLGHGFQQLHLVFRHPHVIPVQALGLADLGQAHIQQNHVCLLGQLHSLHLQGLVVLVVALVALGITHRLQRHARQQLICGVQLGGVHQAGAGALVTGLLGKLADHGHLSALGQRQDIALVLQQHHGLLGGMGGQLMVTFLVELLAGGGSVDGGEHQAQELVHALVQQLHAQTAFLDRGHQFTVAVAAGAGHFQMAAHADTFHVVVGAAPVGDNSTLVAPVVHQNILQKVLTLVGVNAVDLVVSAHDGLGLAFLYGDFKAGEVDLAESALVHHAVVCHAAQLLAVGREMLGAGGDAVLLHTAHEGGGHLAAQVGVFGEILEVTAAQRAALDVQAGAQQHVHVQAGGLFAHQTAHFLAQLRVPAVGHGGSGGQAGGGYTGIQAQVIACAHLLANAGGTVGQKDAGDAQALDGTGGPYIPAGQQTALFLQSHLIDQIFVLHGLNSFAL